MRLTKNFVKVSGDVLRNLAFHAWVVELYKKPNTITFCVGGGTDINKEFLRRGFNVKKKGPLGRETETLLQLEIARSVLEKNAYELKDSLAQKGIHRVRFVTPFLEIGGEICPLDGDEMVRVAYIGYDKLFVVTTPERKADKEREFKTLKRKVQVLAFDE
ncbi:MAG: hypothetical protein WC798_03700 [Candidatus Paceibacterota bacterium]|jgi:hypothetical protein